MLSHRERQPAQGFRTNLPWVRKIHLRGRAAEHETWGRFAGVKLGCPIAYKSVGKVVRDCAWRLVQPNSS